MVYIYYIIGGRGGQGGGGGGGQGLMQASGCNFPLFLVYPVDMLVYIMFEIHHSGREPWISGKEREKNYFITRLNSRYL